MTTEETIASLEAQLKQALERLDEVTEQLRIAQARIEEAHFQRWRYQGQDSNIARRKYGF